MLEETVARVGALYILRVKEVTFEMSSQCYKGTASQGDEGTGMLMECKEQQCKELSRKELILENRKEAEVASVGVGELRQEAGEGDRVVYIQCHTGQTAVRHVDAAGTSPGRSGLGDVICFKLDPGPSNI